MKRLFLFVSLIAASPTFASGDEVKFSGTFETVFSSGKFFGPNKTRDRWSRLLLEANYGPWRLNASHWYYAYCDWYDVDETGLSYVGDNYELTVGRFLPTIGLTNWDDQWYSGFVYLPLAEFRTYGSRKLLMRTSAGVKGEVRSGAWTLQATAFGSEPVYNRLFPERLDRGSVRLQNYQDGFVTGISTLYDFKDGGSGESMHVLDARWTLPQWMIRGEFVDYQNRSLKSEAFFVDANFRPKGWSDVTFLARIDQEVRLSPTRSRLTAYSLGGKARLPFDIQFTLNYTFGPDMNRLPLGGAWSFGLNRTFRF